jgi:YegS/Rv2252/BmrU family lipid kinase
MNTKKNILFLINPISGVGKKEIIPKCINKYIDHSKFSFKIQQTEYAKHAYDICITEKENYDIIVAIGGDGTINEVGNALRNSNCAMGIIPVGSGNGFARHLKIPLKIKKAIKVINRYNVKEIDTGLVNGLPFVSTCGFGYDAHIAVTFNAYRKRGFLSYAKLVKKDYKPYEPLNFEVHINQQIIPVTTFMFTVTNASEFGNGFVISPDSKIDDGQFEIVCLDKVKAKDVLLLAKQIFTGNITKSKFFKAFKTTDTFKIVIKNKTKPVYHIDGEPLTSDTNIFTINILPKSLKVIC